MVRRGDLVNSVSEIELVSVAEGCGSFSLCGGELVECVRVFVAFVFLAKAFGLREGVQGLCRRTVERGAVNHFGGGGYDGH